MRIDTTGNRIGPFYADTPRIAYMYEACIYTNEVYRGNKKWWMGPIERTEKCDDTP